MTLSHEPDRSVMRFLPGLLRSRFVPAKVAYKLWQVFCRSAHGRHYTYRTHQGDQAFQYGGVVGFSTDALFLDLDTYEPEAFALIAFLLDRLWKNNTCITTLDIGANNGQWLCRLKSMDPRFSMHCFEPFQELCQFMSQLVELNDYDRVVINHCLVADEPGKRALYYQEGVTDTASLDADFISGKKSQRTLDAVTVDAYAVKRPDEPIDFIKIDVELMEYEVLCGATSVLKTSQPVVIFETLYSNDKAQLNKQANMAELLEELNYSVFHIRQDTQLELMPGLLADANYQFNNHLAIPNHQCAIIDDLIRVTE